MFLYSPRKRALKRKRLDSAFPINNFLINTVNYRGQQPQAEIIFPPLPTQAPAEGTPGGECTQCEHAVCYDTGCPSSFSQHL